MYAFYIVEEGYNKILECPFFLTLPYKDEDKHKERTWFFMFYMFSFNNIKKVTDKLQVS